MSTDGNNYTVDIEAFAKRHYIKLFAKKYKGAWSVTEMAIISVLARVDTLVKETDRAEEIMNNCDDAIIKLDFAVAGTKQSPKGSGNRAIVYVNHEIRECRILLVYSKNQISPPGETQKWKEVIKENYSEIWGKF